MYFLHNLSFVYELPLNSGDDRAKLTHNALDISFAGHTFIDQGLTNGNRYGAISVCRDPEHLSGALT